MRPGPGDAAPGPLRGASLLLQGLGGRGGRVGWLQTDGAPSPPTRPVLTDTALLLPAGLPASDHGAAVAHAAAHWLHSTPHQPAGPLKPMALAVIGCLEDARVERLLALRFPGTRRWFLGALRRHDGDGLGLGDLLARLARALWDEDWNDPNPWVGRARERVAALVAQSGWRDAAAFRRLGGILANELGQMRVRMPPGHTEPTAYRDDNSWLWRHEATSGHATALDAAEAQAGPPTHAPDAAMHAAGPAITRHPEWDHRIAHLRPDWTTIQEYPTIIFEDETETAPYSSQIDERRPRQARRRPDGPALDLDACVRLRIDQALGLPGDARVFQRHRPRPQPFAVLVLTDLSNSMNAAVQGGPLHVLAKRAGLSLVRTARGLGGMAALHGFSSNTRHAVRYERLLDFGTPMAAQALAGLHAVPARHSTRLGAALRHATRCLLARPEPRRLLLVLTDGAPGDIDVFDPRHLVEDARHAVQAARRAGLDVMCLAGGGEDARAIARIFGRQAHAIHAMQRMPQRLRAMLLQALD